MLLERNAVFSTIFFDTDSHSLCHFGTGSWFLSTLPRVRLPFCGERVILFIRVDPYACGHVHSQYIISIDVIGKTHQISIVKMTE